MKRWPILLALFTFSGMAQADNTSACYAISDSDERRFCLAKAHKDPARCYAIQGASKRAECVAEVSQRGKDN